MDTTNNDPAVAEAAGSNQVARDSADIGSPNDSTAAQEVSNEEFLEAIYGADWEQFQTADQEFEPGTKCLVITATDQDAATKMLPPSWVTEDDSGTSEIGYLLREPVGDLLGAITAVTTLALNSKFPLITSVPAHVLLPQSLNGGGSRLKVWEPRARYSAEDIRAAWSPTTQDRITSLEREANALEDGPGVQVKIEKLLESVSALDNPIGTGRVMTAIAKRTSATKPEMKAVLGKLKIKRKERNKQQQPVGGRLADEWVFVIPEGKFYHKAGKYGATISAFNQAERGESTLEGGEIPPNHVFKEQSGKNVAGLIWYPWAHGDTPSDLVEYDGRELFNTYRPPTYLVPGGDIDRINPWLQLMTHVIPDPAERSVVINHMAATVQHPERKINWQVLLQGGFGVGKDALLRPVFRYYQTASAANEVSGEDLDAGWGNVRAGHKVLVFGEVWRPQDRQFANRVKTWAADTTGGLDHCNLKGGSIVEQPNLYSIYAMSNHRDALHLDRKERRWFVVDAFNVEPLPAETYTHYFHWVDDGGWKAVVSWLLSLDLSAFSWGRLPFKTRAFHALHAANRSDLDDLLHQLLDDKESPFNHDLITLEAVKERVNAHYIFQNSSSGFKNSTIRKALDDLGYVPLGSDNRGERSARIDGKKAVQKTPSLWAAAGTTNFYLKMTKTQIYDACPENLFKAGSKQFDENGIFRGNTNIPGPKMPAGTTK